MKTTKMTALMILVSVVSFQGNAFAASAGRIVVFADKKEGVFKTDQSSRSGSKDNLEELKLVDSQKGVHACFIGTPENVKLILAGMISNENNSSKTDSLKLNTFETEKNGHSINVEITSDTKKSVYLQLKIDPC